MTGDHIESSLRRLEDKRFLTGQGRYVDDVAVLGQLHGVVLRSPHGHALIEGIEAAAARTMPGVRGLFTAADLDADKIGTLPCIAQVATVAPMIVPPRRALARDRVRHVGDPVVFVVADTVQQARDAAERVAVNYRPLPAVIGAREALSLEAPLLWDEAPGNLSYRFERGDKPAVAAAFAKAAHIVEIELVNNRLLAAPIEPRAAIGTYDAASDRFDLLLTGQGVHSLRRQLAEAVFHMPPDRIAVRAPDVGGGFGVKNFLYPEWVLVLWAARRLGRPVRWIAERGEEFISSAQGRDNHTRARLALDRGGRFLALDVDTVANLGAYLSTNGPGSSTNSPASAMGGVYDIPAVFMAVRGVFTNTLPIDAYRGAGKPEANYLIERLADCAARRLALDAVELRRRNLISRFTYRSGLGVTIDCGRFAANSVLRRTAPIGRYRGTKPCDRAVFRRRAARGASRSDRLGSELRPAQIDPSGEAALAIKTAESTLQPGDRLVPKRRIILAVVDKHFPERKSPMPVKAEPAFLFGQVAPDVTPGDVIPPICQQCRCLCGEAKMGPLDFDKPAMMVKPDLRKIAKEVLGEKVLFLGEDFANSRRGLDVPGFPDPAQLAANGDRVAHVFEEVRANNEVEGLVGEWPG
jgi:carbon-monoxide dehydrogenase large subunit